MTVRYEANPPKILPDVNIDESTLKFVNRIRRISTNCDAIHLTENVLGQKRISPIDIGLKIKNYLPNLPITVSLRVRDKSEQEISKFVDSAIQARFAGILVLRGDPSQTGTQDSGLIPSSIVKKLRNEGIDSKIDLYLSVSNKPNFSKITKKLDARPKGFMTQVVQSVEQVQRLKENLEEFDIIPIVLFPSEKNQNSAKFLGLNLTQYKEDFTEFIKKIHRITNDVLITSPSDFTGLAEFLENNQITKYSASG